MARRQTSGARHSLKQDTNQKVTFAKSASAPFVTNSDIEIPIGKRTLFYRFFEIITPVLTFSVIILAVVLSWINAFWGAVYILVWVILFFVKGLGVLYSMVLGRNNFYKSITIDWHRRLLDLQEGKVSHHDKTEFLYEKHQRCVALYTDQKRIEMPIEKVYHLVIMAAYNESFEVIDATMQSLVDTTYNKDRMIICLAYEQRGGEDIAKTARLLQDKYQDNFADFVTVEHPDGLPNEVIGKGGNITYAGKYMSQYLKKHEIDSRFVIVTTLDSDNKPHPMYFDYVTYEYVIYKDRKQLSFQPVSLFLNNIWDAPAPARVIATGNSFWNLICSVRPYALRNFASHSQPMDALEDMNFWSVRTIVEDGHQYWRSYFHFNGHYAVVPIYLPIYQDAVMSETYRKTLKAQFMQLRRWAYGVSDVPYVALNLVKRHTDNMFKGVVKLLMLMESVVSLGTSSIIIAFGGWLPLLFNRAAHHSIEAHQLPITISFIQKIAMVGIIAMVAFSIIMLPPKPKRYKKTRYLMMVLQWALIPITSILYSSLSSLYSQFRLMTGRYLDKFDVTEKTLVKDK